MAARASQNAVFAADHRPTVFASKADTGAARNRRLGLREGLVAVVAERRQVDERHGRCRGERRAGNRVGDLILYRAIARRNRRPCASPRVWQMSIDVDRRHALFFSAAMMNG